MKNKINTEDLKKAMLYEVINIGNELIRDAEYDENGACWKTMFADTNLDISWVKSESIYSGTGGIAIFLLELYNHTRDIKYLDIVLKAIEWLENISKYNQLNSFSFHTGKIGVSYLMLRVYEITDDVQYKKRAIQYLKDNIKYPENAPLCDLLNGLAGTLLGILIMYSKTKDKSFLPYIDNGLRILMENINVGKKGIYWDRFTDSISGLCGFSHGASGVGYVFLELGHYFQNPALYYLAEQAFCYENSFFNRKFKNWPDLRKLKTITNSFQDHKNAYIDKDINYFTSQSDMNAWCHGAAGIGLSRIRAYELLKKNDYLRDIKRAINKTVQTDIKVNGFKGSVILCHGRTGNAELFLEQFRKTKNERFYRLAIEIAKDVIETIKVTGTYSSGYFYDSAKGMEDNSLFMGKAGTGYFFLELLDIYNVPSVLIPKVQENRETSIKSDKKFKYININVKEVQELLLKKIYKRTITYSSKLKINNFALNSKYGNTICNLEKIYSRSVSAKLKNLKNNKGAILNEVFKYEKMILKMDKEVLSNAWLHMKEIQLDRKYNQIIKKNDIDLLVLKVNEDIVITKSKFDWSIKNINSLLVDFNRTKRLNYSVLKKTAMGVREFKITQVHFFLLKLFEGSGKVDDVINNFMKITDTANDDAREALIVHIKDLLKNQFLLEM